jgi:hypothetical protein
MHLRVKPGRERGKRRRAGAMTKRVQAKRQKNGDDGNRQKGNTTNPATKQNGVTLTREVFADGCSEEMPSSSFHDTVAIYCRPQQLNQSQVFLCKSNTPELGHELYFITFYKSK